MVMYENHTEQHTTAQLLLFSVFSNTFTAQAPRHQKEDVSFQM